MRGICTITLTIMLAGTGWCQEKPAAPEQVTCIAQNRDEVIVTDGHGHTKDLVTYVADTGKQLLYSKQVRANDQKARAKAMEAAARECARWVDEQTRPRKHK